MKINIGDNQGHVFIDDTTGKILFIKVENAVKDKFDVRAFASYSNHSDGTHTAINLDPKPIPLNAFGETEEEFKVAEVRMKNIMQNGNDGEHYELD